MKHSWKGAELLRSLLSESCGAADHATKNRPAQEVDHKI